VFSNKRTYKINVSYVVLFKKTGMYLNIGFFNYKVLLVVFSRKFNCQNALNLFCESRIMYIS
jgi:hypothetical protein